MNGNLNIEDPDAPASPSVQHSDGGLPSGAGSLLRARGTRRRALRELRENSRDMAKRQRTANIVYLIQWCYGGNGALAARTFGVTIDARQGVGEATARIIEGRMRLPMGSLEREDFAQQFPPKRLKVPKTPGGPYTSYAMACVRAHRLHLIIALGLLPCRDLPDLLKCSIYVYPKVDSLGRLVNCMPANVARVLEATLRLPPYFLDLPLPPTVRGEIAREALKASMMDAYPFGNMLPSGPPSDPQEQRLLRTSLQGIDYREETSN